MTLDDDVETYFKENPKGNHDEPSQQTKIFMATFSQKFDEFLDRYAVDTERNNADNAEIKEHLKRVNGSIMKLKLWRSYIVGALAALSAIVVPCALMVFAKLLERIGG